MGDNSEISKITYYLEENLRASKKSGLKFIDTRNYKQRLHSAQNHVVYGRRGAGKSSLLSSLDESNDFIKIKLNLEDYKDISFPNIIVHILLEVFEQLGKELKKKNKLWWIIPKYRSLICFITNCREELSEQLSEPDESNENQRTKYITGDEAIAKLNSSLSGIEGRVKSELEKEVSRSVSNVKLDELKKKIPAYKKAINKISSILNDKNIYLILDDFYFIPKSIQPDFVDYFHRLTKDTSLFIKLATIRHRSKLYKQTTETFVGTETKHDIFEIDMDLTLEAFAELQSFMRLLLDNAKSASNSNVQIESLFSGEGFAQLCLASGGVPRDFLSLFVVLANKIVSGEIDKIGKIDATEAALAEFPNKMASLKTDSAEEREMLEQYLTIIRNIVYRDKRTNMFLVAKVDLEEYPEERQAIRELVDLRLLHLVDTNTSCAPSDGRMYEAYMLDVSLYENSRPRSFKQIEPGITDAKSRKDAIRSSPRVDLQELQKIYIGDNAKLLAMTKEE